MTGRPPDDGATRSGGPRRPAEPDGVDLWAACFADVAALPDAWIAPLEPRERRQLARLTRPRDAIGYAGRHAMTRQIVGATVGEPPERLRFDEGPFGKPALSGGGAEALSFSLSRSGEVAVLALRRGAAIGVDIATEESGDARLEGLFAPVEQAFLASLRAPDRSVALLRLWVCKEAVLKAAGYGLSVPPDRVVVEPPLHESTPMRATLLGCDPAAYTVTPFRLTTAVIGAVASDTPVEPRLRWWRRCQWRAACSACTISLTA